MPTITVDGLSVQLPSETLNTINPSIAFGGRSVGNLIGLRDTKTGSFLLPCDADGNIVVVPGNAYSLVKLVEHRPGVNPHQQQNSHQRGDAAVPHASNGAETANKKRNDKREKKEQRGQSNGTQNYPTAAAKSADEGRQHDAASKPQLPQQSNKREPQKRAHEDAAEAQRARSPAKADVPAPRLKKQRAQPKASESDDEPLTAVYGGASAVPAVAPRSPPVAADAPKKRGRKAAKLPAAESGDDEPLSNVFSMNAKAASSSPAHAPAPAPPVVGDAQENRRRSESPMNRQATRPPSARPSSGRKPVPPMDSSSDSD